VEISLYNQITSNPNPSRRFLEATESFSKIEIQRLYQFFLKQSTKKATAELYNALSKCLELGAEHITSTAEDFVQRTFTNVDSKSTIRTVKTLMSRQRNKFVVLFSNGRCIGHVTAQEINDAIHHGYGSLSILSISHRRPIFLIASTPFNEIIDTFSCNTSNIAIVIKEDQILGYLEPNSLIGRTTTNRILPSDWSNKLGTKKYLLQQIGEVAESLNYNAYIVGGFVRDYLLGKSNSDVDCSVEGEAITLGHTLCKKFGGTLINNALFGASHWTTPTGLQFDFTSTRSEIYAQSGALPAISPSTLLQDFQRRDFTINMMAICITPSRWGEFIDPYGGENDLFQNTIRVVHGLSFLDDPTRVFRAARYAGRYNLTVSAETKMLIRTAVTLISLGKDITFERIGNEIQHIFIEDSPHKIWKKLENWGVIQKWFGALEFDISTHLERINNHANKWNLNNSEITAQSYWNILCYALHSSQRKEYINLVATKSNGLRLWKKNPEFIESIVAKLPLMKDYGEIGLLLQQKSTDQCLTALSIEPSIYDGIHWWLQTGQHITCQINGKQLLSLGCPVGRSVGIALQQAKLAAWRGESKEIQLDAAQQTWKHKK
jgi:tRNA nucleotidyltransferase/poly(A) polymerase